MARKFLTPIDLTKLEIQNVALQNLGSDPSTPATGQIYFNTGGTVKVYNGSSWLSLSTTGGTVTSVTGTSPVVSSGGTTPDISLASGYGDTLNPYASKSANTILAAPNGSSGTPSFRSLAAADIPSTLNATTFGGAVAMGTNRITGLGEPSGPQDAATKSYVDNVSTGVNIHDAVVAATTGTIAGVYAAGSTTANPPGDGGTGVGATITYSAAGVVTLDTSVTLAAGDRVLVKDGVTAAAGVSSIANGIYVVTTAGAVGTAAVLTRSTDADNSHFGDLSAGDLVYIIGGNTYAGDQFVQTVKGTATSGTGADTTYSVKIGTDAISYTQFSGAGAVPVATTTALGIASFDANTFDVSSGAVSVKSAGISVGQGGTGANGFNFGSILRGNGTSALSAASAADIVAAISTAAVTNATNATNVAVTNDAATATAVYPTWVGANNGNNGVKTTSASLSFVPSTGQLTADSFKSGWLYGPTSSGTLAIGQTTTSGAITIGVNLTSGTLNLGASSSWSTGSINIGNNASGSPTINIGSGNGTAGTATIAIGNNGVSGTGKSTTTIRGNVLMPQVTTGTAGLVKIATDGTLSTDTATYARKVSQVGSGSGTTIALTHGLGTNLVTAQVYDTSTSTATLVEVDITVTSTVATATFAATTTLSNYTLVVIG
jgi:hypothetical protein